jgi:hypothetical protein
MENDPKILQKFSDTDLSNRESLISLFKNSPIPDNEILSNLGLYHTRQSLSRIFFMHEMYQRIINVNGNIIEFGTRWGQNLALFELFRGMFEPYNYTRKIIAFDTFEGFPSVHEKDGNDSNVSEGAYNVTKGYENYLSDVLKVHKKSNPISHIPNQELVKGNAIHTFKKYLDEHPELIIAFAYFDFDIYEPTYECLKLAKERFTKGSVIGFDELNHPNWPGETLAFNEIFGINNYRIIRSPFASYSSYLIFE